MGNINTVPVEDIKQEHPEVYGQKGIKKVSFKDDKAFPTNRPAKNEK